MTDVRRLRAADLSGAKLFSARLRHANLRGADLSDGDLTEVRLLETVFRDLNLANVVGLQTCGHRGPSMIDHGTLEKSGPLPIPSALASRNA